MSRLFVGLSTALAAALLLGCDPAAQGGPSSPAKAPAPPSPEKKAKGLGDGPFGEFVSRRFGVRIPLPDGRAWRIDDHTENWLSATHAATGSALLVRAWREDGIVNRQRCEERARLWRKLPGQATAEIVERRPLNVPPDFDTVVAVGIEPRPGDPKGSEASIDAFVMAFGGRARRCFAYVFTTSARGHGAEEVVGERLAVMVQGSLSKLVFESDIAPQIGRDREPGSGDGR